MSLGAEIDRLGALARDDRLSPDDLKGASIVVSNIGSVGGHIVGPSHSIANGGDYRDRKGGARTLGVDRRKWQ
jgi:pyruvate/2-oxoglutarate dehydrogenase complex dihydrolipoamide acyltransferase (E2) component